jgi:hypothetical protein
MVRGFLSRMCLGFRNIIGGIAVISLVGGLVFLGKGLLTVFWAMALGLKSQEAFEATASLSRDLQFLAIGFLTFLALGVVALVFWGLGSLLRPR